MRFRRFSITIICMIMAITLMNFMTFAAEFNPSNYSFPGIETDILPEEIRESRDYVRAVARRGVFFAAADLIITNNDGDIDVGAHAYMSEPVDEIYMTIYLERYVIDEDGEEDWEYVDEFNFEFYAEDYPEGELTSESVEFTLTGYPKNEYYRLRGAYAAVKDGLMEGFGPVTEGVYIY